MSKHTKPPYMRDGATVYALTESTNPHARPRHGTPHRVNRFSAQVTSTGRDGAPFEERRATARLFQAAPEMDAAIRALLADYDAGVFERYATLHATARRHIEALRAALPREGEEPCRIS